MKKLFLVAILFIFILSQKSFSGSVIFEEPHEKSSQNEVIYEQIIYSHEWYSAKTSFEVKTYSKKAKKEKEKDVKENEKKLSAFVQKIADKNKFYFEDIVDIFNEYNKKYCLQIAGDEKAPLIIIKIKNV